MYIPVPVEGQLVHGFAGLDVGERLQVQFIDINVAQGYIDFKKLVRPNMDKEHILKKRIGLWIDQREAVIVALTEEGEKITRIKSDAEKQIREVNNSALAALGFPSFTGTHLDFS